MTKSLQKMYEVHHETGNRLRQTLLEKVRGEILKKWCGTGKKVVDLGCRDGTLTRHFLEGNDVLGCDIDAEAMAYAHKTYGFKTQQVDLNAAYPSKTRNSTSARCSSICPTGVLRSPKSNAFCARGAP